MEKGISDKLVDCDADWISIRSVMKPIPPEIRNIIEN
jgi:hypothetical protein